MPKSLSRNILVLLILLTSYANAQQRTAGGKYLGSLNVTFSRVEFYIDLRYLEARHVPDSINISIENAAQLKPLVEHGLQNHLYGLEIMNASRPDLAAIFDLLLKFPNLTCLRIFDPFFSRSTDKNYSLPENIKALQQLKVVQFVNTAHLDVQDAINKISQLPHLEGVEFSGYHFPIAMGLSKLDNINCMKLSTVNLEGVDVSTTKWKVLRLSGTLPKRDQDTAVLRKISGIKSLQSLYLEYCALGDGSTLSDIKQLKTLSISGCEIDRPNQIFDRLSKLKTLTTLAVLFTRDSTQLITGVENISALKTLTINYLPSLAKNHEQLIAINKLKSLEGLTLSDKLTGMPEIFTGLDHLKRVNISENVITALPQSLFNLPQLEYLNASGNKLMGLPEQLACKNLKELNLSYNKLITLPVSITKSHSLEKIDLTNNKLKTLPLGWENLKTLKDLKLTSNYLTAVPQGIEKLTKLESLDLSTNYITSFPDIPPNSYALRTLKMALNNLTSLPENIGTYSNLEVLGVGGNILSALPESLGKCTRLTELWAYSDFIRSHFDSDKIGLSQVVYDKSDSTHLNNIKAIPKGLAAAKNLQKLILSNNRSIDEASIFYVLLATPRKSIEVNLSRDNIKQLPADSRWADMSFVNLDLSYNTLTTLPAEFANVTLINGVNLSGNPLNNIGMRVPATSTKAELKMLYDELGVAIPNYNISNQEYAQALCKRAIGAGYGRNVDYERVVKYANQALALDPDTYAKSIFYNNIGEARYFTGDYTGAIKDFDAFLDKEKKDFMHFANLIDPVIHYKAEAQLALGRPKDAAQTYIYGAKTYDTDGAWQQAAVLYKVAGDNAAAKHLMDTAIQYNEKRMAYNAKSKYPTGDILLDYAEILIMAGQPAKAIEALNTPDFKSSLKSGASIKSYLIATAGNFDKSARFDDLTRSVKESVAVNGKPTNWDFTMFNRWLRISGVPDDKQKELLSLQDLLK